MKSVDSFYELGPSRPTVCCWFLLEEGVLLCEGSDDGWSVKRTANYGPAVFVRVLA